MILKNLSKLLPLFPLFTFFCIIFPYIMTENKINKIQIIDEDSGDNSIDMEDYVIKTNIELKNLKERCSKLKIPIEPQQYSVSPLQNMKSRLKENYTEITFNNANKNIDYDYPKRINVDKTIKKKILITGVTLGVWSIGTIIYILIKKDIL